MRRIQLIEYRTTTAVHLEASEAAALGQVVPGLTVAPSVSFPGCFDLTPSSYVGLVRCLDLEVEIAPKITIDRLLFLVAYSLDPMAWKDQQVHFQLHDSIVEAIIPGFLHQVERAFRLGVLQGYRVVEDAECTVRGRIRFEDQLRRRFGRSYPIEVRYDDFTIDIELNRLIKAALYRLGRIPLRSAAVRDRLRHFQSALAEVSPVEYDPRNMPHISYNRLNERYRPAVELAKLIIRSTSFEHGEGTVVSSAFLMNMNDVFEDFVVVALREALQVSERTFPQGASGRQLCLDTDQNVRLEPDISWWDGQQCTFVGDVKYKRTKASGVPNADLYQLLAYTVGTNLPEGLLIYAAGESPEFQHRIERAGKTLDIVTVELEGTPEDILARIGGIGERICGMRRRALSANGGAAVRRVS